MIDTKIIKMVDLNGQYFRIKEEVDRGIQTVIQSSQFINGPIVSEFAHRLEDYLSVQHVIPCGNGTDALMIALMALDLKPGDEVITVPHTFVATAEVISLLGLKPIFIDIDADSFNMDVSKLEAAITPRTKCVIPVHIYGQGCDMDAIMSIASKHELFVIEDNAQSIGAKHRGENAYGTIGHIGCTSFYPSKNLGAYGDAGAVYTNDAELANRIKQISNHGQEQKYLSKRLGLNSRLDSLQAVVLNAKLKLLDEFISDRRNAAAQYDALLSGVEGIKIPKRIDYSDHVFHQYTVTLDGDRDAIRESLKQAGIPTMIYYPHPLHTMPIYENDNAVCPVSEKMAKQTLSLPMHTELNEEQIKYISQKLIEYAKV